MTSKDLNIHLKNEEKKTQKDKTFLSLKLIAIFFKFSQ
jgi:hypothetical protein